MKPVSLAEAVKPTKAPDTRRTPTRTPRTKNDGKRGKAGRPREGFPRDESDAFDLRVLPETIPNVEVDRVRTDEGKRVTVILSERDAAALAAARDLDGVTASERIRSMVAVWRSVTEVGDLVDRVSKPTARSQK